MNYNEKAIRNLQYKKHLLNKQIDSLYEELGLLEEEKESITDEETINLYDETIENLEIHIGALEDKTYVIDDKIKMMRA